MFTFICFLANIKKKFTSACMTLDFSCTNLPLEAANTKEKTRQQKMCCLVLA